MIERFLRYSLEHGRKIAFLAEEDGRIRRCLGTVTSLGKETFRYVTGRSSREREMALSAVLSASYARGDEGDTLKNERLEEENGRTEAFRE